MVPARPLRFVRPTHGADEMVVPALSYLLIVFYFYYRNNIQHYCQSLSLNVDITPMDQRDPPLRKGVKKINSLQAWPALRIQIRKYV